MGNPITEKRGLLIVLIVGTVVVFVGLLWGIATFLPVTLPVSPGQTDTVEAMRVNENCASPVGYWVNHPELYPAQLVIGDKVYQGRELDQVFSGQTDLPALIQAQLAGAYLNILMGADQSYIQSTIFEAYGWLVAHPVGSQVGVAELEEGKRLLSLLEAYNQGMTGVPACRSAVQYIATRVSLESSTSTTSVTETAVASGTIEASETATPTDTEVSLPGYTYVAPTRTPTPTTAVPVYFSPTPTPTRTTAPPPTNTTAPTPTRTPTIEPTLPPTDTPSPTFPPP